MVLVLLRVPALAPRWARSQAFSFSLDSQHLLATHVLNFQSNSIIPKQLYSIYIYFVWRRMILSSSGNIQYLLYMKSSNQKSTIRKPTKSGTNSKNLALALSSGPFSPSNHQAPTPTPTPAPTTKQQDHSEASFRITQSIISRWQLLPSLLGIRQFADIGMFLP